MFIGIMIYEAVDRFVPRYKVFIPRLEKLHNLNVKVEIGIIFVDVLQKIILVISLLGIPLEYDDCVPH